MVWWLRFKSLYLPSKRLVRNRGKRTNTENKTGVKADGDTELFLDKLLAIPEDYGCLCSFSDDILIYVHAKSIVHNKRQNYGNSNCEAASMIEKAAEEGRKSKHDT
jgi:hypothetical protein